jgi:undecaprenyl-diphosphatase
MTILHAIIQGIIQGLTEFLPVSSSGHLAVYQYFFTSGEDDNAFLFDAILHLGTLVAVFIAFKEKVWALIKELGSMFKDIFKGQFFKHRMNPNRRMIVMMIISLLVLIPFYPFKDAIENVATNHIIILGCLFLYTSIILFISDRFNKGKKTEADITPMNALTVGLFQGIALFPGVSRSGSTISAGLFCGFNRKLATEYSFILGIPTILAGCLLEIKDYIGSVSDGTATAINIPAYVVGFFVSAIVGILAIKMVKWLVNSNKFVIFSIYTLILGITVIIAGIVK